MVTIENAIADLSGKRPAVTIKINEDKVVKHLVERTLTTYEQRVTAALEAQEERLAALGDARISESATQLSAATTVAQRLADKLEHKSRALTWQAIGRLAMALVPIALVAVAVASLLGVVGWLYGVGPLFGWAWASFGEAGTWWAKALIALGTLTAAAAVTYAVYQGGQWLHRKYKGW